MCEIRFGKVDGMCVKSSNSSITSITISIFNKLFSKNKFILKPVNERNIKIVFNKPRDH